MQCDDQWTTRSRCLAMWFSSRMHADVSLSNFCAFRTFPLGASEAQLQIDGLELIGLQSASSRCLIEWHAGIPFSFPDDFDPKLFAIVIGAPLNAFHSPSVHIPLTATGVAGQVVSDGWRSFPIRFSIRSSILRFAFLFALLFAYKRPNSALRRQTLALLTANCSDTIIWPFITGALLRRAALMQAAWRIALNWIIT